MLKDDADDSRSAEDKKGSVISDINRICCGTLLSVNNGNLLSKIEKEKLKKE